MNMIEITLCIIAIVTCWIWVPVMLMLALGVFAWGLYIALSIWEWISERFSR